MKTAITLTMILAAANVIAQDSVPAYNAGNWQKGYEILDPCRRSATIIHSDEMTCLFSNDGSDFMCVEEQLYRDDYYHFCGSPFPLELKTQSTQEDFELAILRSGSKILAVID